MNILAFLSFLSLLGIVSGATFQDCGSTVKNLQIHIPNCPGSGPACIFTSGQTASIEAAFTGAAPFRSATVKLSGVIGHIKIPFPLTSPEACGRWGLECPSAAGAHQTLRVDIPITSQYPKVKVGVELQLVSDTAETLICKTIPVEIK
ncbi:hypothetical protein C2857_006578 [Epichloe festucae Fl1]|uniref:Phosphatidylglycerol/phosphatidylinositol transfer protein n=1 Tax=Epichloe festucae (strain Fl1) TaxID=877507 RepID=A0A7S9KLS0_EPIFF|nr:hypothetical protein C2857_006578 [Epichloe festucae Fl1]